tara:strand:+ start:458 stop:1309 length:852 start_codon:yes stop_codon:yes gene_type:complete
MAKTYYTFVVALVITFLSAIIYLFVFNREPERLSQLITMDFIYFVIPTVLFLPITATWGKNIITELLGEPKDFKDAVLDVLIGVGAGIGLAIFFLADFGYKSIAGDMYAPLATTAEDMGTDLMASVMSASPLPHMITAWVFDMKTGLAEEFFASMWRLGIFYALTIGVFAGMGIASRTDKPSDIFFNPVLLLIVFCGTGLMFAGLHVFVPIYQSVGIPAFISAFTASMVFSTLFFWRGFLSAALGHGTYNFVISMLSATGLHVILTWMFFILIFVVIIYFVMR